MANGSCGAHKPYASKAAAAYAASWHITCPKCKAGRPIGVWLCEPSRKHHHWGHRRLEPAAAARTERAG
jgi:hypothetical protein